MLINNMASTWIEMLKNSQKTCIIQDNRRKIHFTFANGNELAEEYDLKTNELVGRAMTHFFAWLKLF